MLIEWKYFWEHACKWDLASFFSFCEFGAHIIIKIALHFPTMYSHIFKFLCVFLLPSCNVWKDLEISEYNILYTCYNCYFKHLMKKNPCMKAALIRVFLERSYSLLFVFSFKNFIPILAIHYNYFNQLKQKKPIKGYDPKFGLNTSILFYPGMGKWSWMYFTSLLS